ncbi:MAG: hypothetical protein HGB37_04215 [Candidatus Moranbacteria bacterium]|nr:hypothetical protein [Candidatus Moranbacteria bacterium]
MTKITESNVEDLAIELDEFCDYSDTGIGCPYFNNRGKKSENVPVCAPSAY